MNMLRRVSSRVVREVGKALDPKHRQWLRHKRSVDRDFDAKHGVDTGGYTYLNKLNINSANWRDGNSHIAADPQEFREAIEAVDADLSRFTFIDLGAGKGRALLLAEQYPFKRAFGVEFAAELVEVAEANGVDVIHGDATTYELPNEPTLLFLYNPFGRETMDIVARRTRNSLDDYPRDLTVLYLNPFHEEAWLSQGFKRVHKGPHFSVLTSA